MSKDKENIKDKFWYTVVDTMLGKLTKKKRLKKMNPEDYETLKSLYEEFDGSWELLAKGDMASWQKLRSVCKGFLKVRKEQKKRPYEPEEDND